MTYSNRITVEAAEAALKRIAALRAPEGLADRIEAQLRVEARSAVVAPRRSPLAGLFALGWMRMAASAAIALLVAGGGWAVAFQAGQTLEARQGAAPRVVATPAGGGFSTGAAIRTPQTVEGPAVPAAKGNAAPVATGSTGAAKAAAAKKKGRKATASTTAK